VPTEQIFALVKHAVLEALPHLAPEDVTIDKSLSDLGANSVDRMEVVILSMEKMSLKIPMMSFAGVNNLAGLVDVLKAHRA
jgi:polyketide biosynthesis acyl carrier protein